MGHTYVWALLNAEMVQGGEGDEDDDDDEEDEEGCRGGDWSTDIDLSKKKNELCSPEEDCQTWFPGVDSKRRLTRS